MTPQETRYRSVANRIGIAMLVFFGAFIAFQIIIMIVPMFTSLMPAVAGTVVYEITYGIGYALAFAAPCIFFYFASKGQPREPLDLKFTLPRETPLYIFASIAIVAAAGYVNSLLMDLIHFDIFAQEETATGLMTNYQLVLMVFTTAIVPGFIEELFFRGVILKNLLPYGRTTAVVASAFLFGVMHQNPAQFFYTTVAGLVLGYIYVRTRSLWCCILIHMCNNFLSIVYTVLYDRLPEESAPILLLGIELAVFALGIVAAIFLVLSEKRDRKQIFLEGAFERDLPAAPEYAAEAIPLGRRVRLFFSVPMIVFLALAAVEMALLLVIYMFV